MRVDNVPSYNFYEKEKQVCARHSYEKGEE